MACNICLEEDDNVVNTCECSYRAHEECIKSWHSNVVYGRIIHKSHLCCPQCKRLGRYNNVKISNEEILKVLTNNPGWSYIMCPSCKELKQYVQESCSNHFETAYRLVCNDCSPKSFKLCPNCSVIIEKDGGCLHMTCTNCQTHFCWICLDIFNTTDMYNHIYTYHKKIVKSELRYQDYLYMIENREIEFNKIPTEYYTEQLVDIALKNCPITIKYIKQTPDLCLKAVKYNGISLEYIDPDLPNYYEICCEAIKHGSYVFSILWNDSSKHDICLEIIKSNGLLIANVNKPSYQLCLEAVKQNCYALKYIEPSIDNYREICFEAIKRDPITVRFMKIIDKELHMSAIKRNGCVLRYINDQDTELCLEAVKQNGLSLRYVHYQTPELCLEAVKQNGHALQYVDYCTREICLEAIRQNAYALQYIKNYNLSYYKELCFAAVRKYGDTIHYSRIRTEEICLEAVKQDGNALRYINKQTPAICIEAVKNCPNAMYYIRVNRKEWNKEWYLDMCLEGVKKDGYSIRYVRKQTPVICLEAIKQNCCALRYINNQKLEYCLEAIKIDPSAIRYIKNQTIEHCLEALKRDPLVIKYVDRKFQEICKESLKNNEDISKN